MSIVKRIHNWLVAAGKLKSLWQYLLFVALAGVFWVVMALNDEVQTDFTVRIEVVNVPDSVTFITDPPKQLTLTMRDKGTLVLRRKFMEAPVVRISFKEFASDNTLTVTSSAMMSRLRAIFGTGASLSVTSNDSFSINYTTEPGKVVPIRVDANVTAALGKVINGTPKLNISRATLYAVGNVTDTIAYVITEPIIRRDLTDPLKVTVKIRPIPGVRIEPSVVEVTIPVEPLENRKIMVPIETIGVPENESVSLFPQTIEVSYLVPMSTHTDIPASAFKVVANYADVSASNTDHVNVRIVDVPKGVQNASIALDSVEYTIIRNAQ
ncbi:MAG: hypothetical protein NC217_07805 [Muribaculaceae bacterium]|nr:hypothetical protein [Muribaculaceae bacterium]